MKERAIYYLSGIITGILLCVVLWSFTAEDRIESLSAINIANIIEEYEAEGYVVDKLNMKKKSDCLEIIDCNFVFEPNEASYKAWLGWE